MKPTDAPIGSVWEYEYGGNIYVVLHEPFYDAEMNVNRRWCFVLAGSVGVGLTTITDKSDWNTYSTRLS